MRRSCDRTFINDKSEVWSPDTPVGESGVMRRKLLLTKRDFPLYLNIAYNPDVSASTLSSSPGINHTTIIQRNDITLTQASPIIIWHSNTPGNQDCIVVGIGPSVFG